MPPSSIERDVTSSPPAPDPAIERHDAVLGDPARGARAGRRLAVAVAALGLVGGALLYVAGPTLVEQVLSDRSAEVIAKNAGRARKAAVAAAAGGLCGAALVLALTRPWFLRRCVGGATPESLGAIRVLVCFILLLIVRQDDLSAAAVLPPEMREPMGLLELLRKLPGVNALLAAEGGLRAVDWGTTALLVVGLVGLGTRVVIPLAAAGFFVYAGVLREYSWFTHQGLIPLYVLAVLAFTPCGDAYSLDRRLRARRGRPVPPLDVKTYAYGWYRYACWAPVAILYVFAGLSKLRNGGWDWWNAANMRHHLIGSTMQPMAYEWEWSLMLTDAPDVLFAVFGIGGLLTELAAGLVLVWPRVRPVIAVMLVGLHVGIWLFQNILFYDLILLQLMLIDFRPLRDWARRRVGATTAAAPARERSTDAAPARLTPGVFPRVVLGGVAALMVAVWTLRAEPYPLTGVQMFSSNNRNHRGTIHYTAAYAHYDSGAVERAYLDRAIGVFSEARYRRVLDMGMDERYRPVAAKVFAVAGERMNRGAAPGRRVERFEVQRRKWNYRTDRDDPNRGETLLRVFFDVGPNPDPPTATRPAAR